MNIEQKLEECRNRSEGYGRKYGAFSTADDYLKTVYAALYDEAEGSSVADRDAWVKRHEDYKAAIKRKENCYADWKEAELYVKLLLAEIDVWRSKEASSRWVDKAHV